MGQSDQLPLPIEIILSCSICQATLPEIYEQTESDKGFRDTDDSTQELAVTKLFLTECAHLTCGKHLAGGGVPFHATGEKPKAPCPYCVQETGNHDQKVLYGIRGLDEGMFDEDIPDVWVRSPPISLGGDDAAMQAMRFQYLSLIRFGSHAFVKLRELRQNEKQLNTTLRDSHQCCRQLQGEIDGLRSTLRDLQKCEASLKVWKEREPKLLHYLGVFDQVTRENTKLREQLTAMGYAVPARKWTKHPSDHDKSDHQNEGDMSNRKQMIDLTTEKHEPEGQPESITSPTRDIPNATDISSNRRDSSYKIACSNLKRVYEDNGDVERVSKNPRPRMGREDSSKLMPPPPKPPPPKPQWPPEESHLNTLRQQEVTNKQQEMFDPIIQIEKHNNREHSSISQRTTQPKSYIPFTPLRHASSHPSHQDVNRHSTPPTQPYPLQSHDKYPDRLQPLVGSQMHPGHGKFTPEPKQKPFTPHHPTPGRGNLMQQYGHHPIDEPAYHRRESRDNGYYTSHGIYNNSYGHTNMPTFTAAGRGFPTTPRYGNTSHETPARQRSVAGYNTPIQLPNRKPQNLSSTSMKVPLVPRNAVSSPFFSTSARAQQNGPVTLSTRSKANSRILTSNGVDRYASSGVRHGHAPPSTPSWQNLIYMNNRVQDPRMFAPIAAERNLYMDDGIEPTMSFPHLERSAGPSRSVGVYSGNARSTRNEYYPQLQDARRSNFNHEEREWAPPQQPQSSHVPNLRNSTPWQPRRIPQRTEDIHLGDLLDGVIPAGSIIGK